MSLEDDILKDIGSDEEGDKSNQENGSPELNQDQANKVPTEKGSDTIKPEKENDDPVELVVEEMIYTSDNLQDIEEELKSKGWKTISSAPSILVIAKAYSTAGVLVLVKTKSTTSTNFLDGYRLATSTDDGSAIFKRC